MKLTNILRDLLKEEYDESVLYGYHITLKENLDSIRKNGFRVGHRAMQGKGFYAFYNYNHASRYVNKESNRKPFIIIKFEISRKKSILYLNMDVAKQVLGDEYRITDQFIKFFGSLEDIYENWGIERRFNMSLDDFINKLNDIENNNNEDNQKTLLFHLMPSRISDELDLMYDGEYGKQFRINNTHLIGKVVGYEYFDDDDGWVYHHIGVLDDIPNTEEFKDLREFIKNNFRSDVNILHVRKKLDDLLMNTRNNREYEYYNRLLGLMYKL